MVQVELPPGELIIMVPTKELGDALYNDKVRHARVMSQEHRFLVGAELFDLACKFTVAGIRDMHPEADEERVRELLAERIALGRRMGM
jgi:hypothetical protein